MMNTIPGIAPMSLAAPGLETHFRYDGRAAPDLIMLLRLTADALEMAIGDGRIDAAKIPEHAQVLVDVGRAAVWIGPGPANKA